MQRQAQRLRAAKPLAESSKARQLEVIAAAWRTQAEDAIKILQDLDLDRPTQQVNSGTLPHVC